MCVCTSMRCCVDCRSICIFPQHFVWNKLNRNTLLLYRWIIKSLVYGTDLAAINVERKKCVQKTPLALFTLHITLWAQFVCETHNASYIYFTAPHILSSSLFQKYTLIEHNLLISNLNCNFLWHFYTNLCVLFFVIFSFANRRQ